MSKRCPYCNQPLPKASSFCLHCFSAVNPLKEVSAPLQKSDKNLIPLVSILAVIVIVCAVGTVILNLDKTDNVSYTEQTVSANTSVSTKATEKPSVTTSAASESSVQPATATRPSTVTETELMTEASEAAPPSTTKNTVKKTTASTAVVISSGVLKKYPSARSSSSYTIPYKVTKIADNAFETNTHLKSLKFSKRESLQCNWAKLFSSLPNLKTIYIYAGTSVDTEGMQYFDGEIVYYD